jgi:hypothetical protein
MKRPWRWYRSRRALTQWGLGILALFVVLIIIGTLSPDPEQEAAEQAAKAATTTATASETSTPTARPARTTRAKATAAAAKPRGSSRNAIVALDALPVKGRAPKTGYSREQFGDGWATVSGCDMRDRILARDLTRRTYETGDTCAVQSGHLNDPYTAAAITFERGGASEVDIDHVVALSDAWQKGAQQWSAGRRVAFANDPLNLLSVDAHNNRAKGDGDAATWLPPNKRFRCDYVARQVAVKRKYTAWITQSEHDSIESVLKTCPSEKLPRAGIVRVPVIPTHTAATPTLTAEPTWTATPKAEESSGGGRVFANCDAVRAAGLAPLTRGTADYDANPNLDRDKDGLACE